MNRLDVLIAVVAIGFFACWLLLRQIGNYLRRCLLKLSEIESTTTATKNVLNDIAITLDHVKETVFDSQEDALL
jgi:hypothetical protein